MVYVITILDENGMPMPGAKLIFGARDGNGTLNLIADKNGSVSIDENVTGPLDGVAVYWTASAPGYQTYTWFNDEGINGNKTVTLARDANLLQVLGLGALLAAGIYQITKKGKKVGAIDLKNDVYPLVLPVGILVGGYLIYNALFGDSSEDKNRQDALDKDIANAEAQQAPTMSDSELATAANAIKEDLGYSWVANNFSDAAHQLSKPRNTADMLKLIKAFGTHWITTFGIPRGKFTLEEYVASQLPQSYTDEVNNYYSAQGIDFKF